MRRLLSGFHTAVDHCATAQASLSVMSSRPTQARKSQETLPALEGADLQALSQLSFEQILERLEGVVGELERGELPLEQALAAFERGVMLSRKGAAQLDDAERRIEVLLGDGDSVALRPFDKELDNDE